MKNYSKHFSRKSFGNLIKLLISFIIVAFGIAISIKSNLGSLPWDVLNQGIGNSFNISIGQANQYIGLCILVVSMLLGLRIGMGTFLNVSIMGILIDFILSNIFTLTISTIYMKIVLLFLGIFLISFGTYLYLGCGLGYAPRDGLMVVISRKTNISMGTVRIILEFFAVSVGYYLGGIVGIGTVVSSLGTGLIIKLLMSLSRNKSF